MINKKTKNVKSKVSLEQFVQQLEEQASPKPHTMDDDDFPPRPLSKSSSNKEEIKK